jgi:hypothetical protein
MKFITIAECLGRKECPYLKRWCINFIAFSIRLHHWIASDDDRFQHDHPWAFITFVLKGGYTDVSPQGKQRMGKWAIAFRPALHRHTVQVDKGGSWTIMITGPQTRNWGFWVKDKFVKANTYFIKFGHHPCKED